MGKIWLKQIEGTQESCFKEVDRGYLQRENNASELNSNGSNDGVTEENLERALKNFILTEAEDSGKRLPKFITTC